MLRGALFLLMYYATTVPADVPPAQVAEIEHLISFVQNSQCTMTRNGTDYPPQKAVSHIRKKYDYFRDDIKNTEDFIEYAASRSTMSGKDYTVICPGEKAMTTRQWLLNELTRLRSSN
jgi:hypothetical protein